MSTIARNLLDATSDVTFFVGMGSPAGIQAPVGSLYSQRDGTVSSMLHLKTGTGVNDWSAVQAGGSSSVSWTEVTGKPIGLVSSSIQVTFGQLSGIPTGLVSSSVQVSYPALSNIPAGIVSSSAQASSWTVQNATQLGGIGAANYARLDGASNNTFTGINTFIPRIRLNGTTGQFRGVEFSTSDALRWFIYQNAESEPGGNAGGTLRIARYTDAEGYIDDVFIANRQTGVITLGPANTEALNVAGIRGRFTGTGTSDDNGIQLFSNVSIGDAGGWGAAFANGRVPTRGLGVAGAINVGYANGAPSTITGPLTVANGGQTLNLRETGATTHTYLAFQNSSGVRKGYIGFPGNLNSHIEFANEFGNEFRFATSVGVRTRIADFGVATTQLCNINGEARFLDNGSYTLLYDPNNRIAMFLGGSGDPGNYYDNTTHVFRNRLATVNYATINDGGMTLQRTNANTTQQDVLTVLKSSEAGATTGLYVSSNGRAGGNGIIRLAASGDNNKQMELATGNFVFMQANTNGFVTLTNTGLGRMRLVDSNSGDNEGIWYGAADQWFVGRTADSFRIFRSGAGIGGDLLLINGSSATFGVGGVTTTFNSNGINTSNFILTSDARLKTNLVPLTNALSKVHRLYGYTYDMKNVREVGVLAQDVQTVLPEAVTTNDDGYMGVAYDRLIPLLIESIKELTAKVHQLETHR